MRETPGLSNTATTEDPNVIGEAKRVSQNGYGVGDIIRWEAEASADVSLDEISTAQEKAGYSPLGYGGPNNVRIEEGKVYWTCYASCD